MEKRPRETFLRTLRKEPPPEDQRRKLISRYKRGGLSEFESEVAKRMEGVNIVQSSTTDPISRELLWWKYVGDFWWCRYRKKVKRYEFARMMAQLDGTNQLDGLWDSRRHVTHQPGVMVFRALDPLTRGYIVGRNEYEVFVEWEDRDTGVRGLPSPVRDSKLLIFKYIEDFEQYRVIFSNLRKSC